MDFKLTSGGDLDFSTDDLVLLDHIEAVAQHLRIRLRFFLGEWFLDQRVGIPYFEKILGKVGRRENVVRSILRKAILDTSGVEALRSLSLTYTGETRLLTLEFDADIVGADQPITFIEEMII